MDSGEWWGEDCLRLFNTLQDKQNRGAPTFFRLRYFSAKDIFGNISTFKTFYSTCVLVFLNVIFMVP